MDTPLLFMKCVMMGIRIVEMGKYQPKPSCSSFCNQVEPNFQCTFNPGFTPDECWCSPRIENALIDNNTLGTITVNFDVAPL